MEADVALALGDTSIGLTGHFTTTAACSQPGYTIRAVLILRQCDCGLYRAFIHQFGHCFSMAYSLWTVRDKAAKETVPALMEFIIWLRFF